MREFMELDTDEDDDPPPDEDEPAPGVMESHWAEVGLALLEARRGSERAAEKPAGRVRAERGGGSCQAGV